MSASSREHLPAFQPELAPDQIGRLDAVRAFVDRRDAGVAKMLGGAGLLDIAHAAMDLHAEARHLAADVGAIGLDQRRQQVRARPRRLVAGAPAVGPPGR